MYIDIFIFHIFMYIYVHTHIYIYIYIFIYTHAYLYLYSASFSRYVFIAVHNLNNYYVRLATGNHSFVSFFFLTELNAK